jgi:hypothetical protein
MEHQLPHVWQLLPVDLFKLGRVCANGGAGRCEGWHLGKNVTRFPKKDWRFEIG